LQNKTIRVTLFIMPATGGVLAMIDSKALAQEVERARRARGEAEDARCAVEELLSEVGHDPRTWRRLAQVDLHVEGGRARAAGADALSAALR
jgi:hypothetical protein